MDTISVEALSVAAFARALHALELPDRGDVVVTATEGGEPWATVDIGVLTAGTRSIFPRFLRGGRGDADRRQAHMGCIVYESQNHMQRGLTLAVDRARRMAR